MVTFSPGLMLKCAFPILVTPNIQLIVGEDGKMAVPVAERELAQVRAALQSGYPFEPC